MEIEIKEKMKLDKNLTYFSNIDFASKSVDKYQRSVFSVIKILWSHSQ